MRDSGGKLLDSGNARINTEQAWGGAGGQVAEESGDRLLAALGKAGAADQADPHAADQHDTGQRGDDVGAHRPLGVCAVAFAKEGIRFARAPARYGRGVEGMDGALLAAQAHRFNRQALHAPAQCPLEKSVERELAPLQHALDPVPAPAQLHDIGQRGAGETPLMVDELAGKHSEEHDAQKVRGTRGQRVQQVVKCMRCQVHWLRGQRKRAIGWSRHPPSISDFWPLLLLNW